MPKAAPSSPIICSPGAGLAYLQANVEKGRLTLQPENSSCRYIVSAAELYSLLAEENPAAAMAPPGPGLPGHSCIGTNPDKGREHPLADLAQFQAEESPEGEVWLRLAVAPQLLQIQFPADLALLLFHYAGLPD